MKTRAQATSPPAADLSTQITADRLENTTFSAIVESAPDAIILVYREGLIVLVNTQTEKLFGYRREELLGQPIELLLPETLRERHVAQRDAFFARPHQRAMAGIFDLAGQRKDGSEIAVDISLNPLEPSQKGLVICIVRDITEHRQLQEEMARLAAFVNLNPNPVLECDATGRITYANPAAESLLAPLLTPDSNAPVSPLPDLPRLVHRCLEEHIEINGQETQIGDQIFLWSLRPLPMSDRVHLYATDISARKQAEETLRTLSLLDDLTGLYNRRGFLALAAQQLKLARRNQRQLLLLFADLDGMKQINDTYGHSAGDQALVETAGLVKGTFRQSDIVARLGGDEFSALAIDTSKNSSGTLTTRLQEKVDARNRQTNRPYKLSLSVGLALYAPEQPCSLDELIARADAAMYDCKRRKRNRRTP